MSIFSEGEFYKLLDSNWLTFNLIMVLNKLNEVIGIIGIIIHKELILIYNLIQEKRRNGPNTRNRELVNAVYICDSKFTCTGW